MNPRTAAQRFRDAQAERRRELEQLKKARAWELARRHTVSQSNEQALSMRNRAIRAAHRQTGDGYQALADRYTLSRTTIRGILNGFYYTYSPKSGRYLRQARPRAMDATYRDREIRRVRKAIDALRIELIELLEGA